MMIMMMMMMMMIMMMMMTMILMIIIVHLFSPPESIYCHNAYSTKIRCSERHHHDDPPHHNHPMIIIITIIICNIILIKITSHQSGIHIQASTPLPPWSVAPPSLEPRLKLVEAPAHLDHHHDHDGNGDSNIVNGNSDDGNTSTSTIFSTLPSVLAATQVYFPSPSLPIFSTWSYEDQLIIIISSSHHHHIIIIIDIIITNGCI